MAKLKCGVMTPAKTLQTLDNAPVEYCPVIVSEDVRMMQQIQVHAAVQPAGTSPLAKVEPLWRLAKPPRGG